MIKDSTTRVQKYLDRLATAKGYHKECIHTFFDKDGNEIPLLVSDLKELAQVIYDDLNLSEKEKIMTYESWRISYQSSEAAARSAWQEMIRLHHRVNELESQLPASVITGAIYDFAGYLTSLPHKEAIHCSEVHEAPPMVKAITEWCKRRNLCTADARVKTWREAIATHPTQQGLDAQTIKHISALSELVRMPNAEHFADAHNAAVRHLRSLAAQAKQGGV